MTDLHLLVRLDAFRDDHPGIGIKEGEFGEWHAALPLDDGKYDEASGHLHNRDLGLLLDRLDELLEGGRARSGP
jgi:hypothetical protein